MIRLCPIVAAMLMAAPASAHGTLAGGGGFYAAALHPFVAFEHLLLLLGLGLLLGRGARRDQLSLAALALGLAAGLAFGANGASWGAVPAALLIAGVATGVGLAGALFPPWWMLRTSAAGIGLLIGLDTDGPLPTGAGGAAPWSIYAGVFVGVFLLVLNAMALASVAARPPFSIGVRVAGSWIAAVSLMVLALEVRRLGGGA